MATIELITEDDVIQYTRSKRKDLVEELTKNGAPKDKDEQHVLLSALDGLDRSALTRLKIKTEETNNKNQQNIAALMAKVLTSINPSETFVVEGTCREIPILDERIPDPILVAGETDLNPEQLDYDKFMANYTSSD